MGPEACARWWAQIRHSQSLVKAMAHLAGSFLLAIVPLLAGATTPLLLHSRSALVYDLITDQVLLEKHADGVAPLGFRRWTRR